MSLNTSYMNLLAIGQAPNGWIWAMALGFAAICLIMMLIVLIQKPKGGGLSGAFGGGAGGGSESAFIGGRVGDVLTWATVICFVLFLLLAMGMTWGIKGGGADKPEDPQGEAQVDGQTPDAGAGAGTPAPEVDTTGDTGTAPDAESSSEGNAADEAAAPAPAEPAEPAPAE